MLNQPLSELFHRMAQILEFLGDPNDKFKIRAYVNASISLQDAQEDVGKMAKEKRLREIPGIGQGIAYKIDEFMKTGHVMEFEKMKLLIPKGFFEMLEISSLGPKKVKALNLALGIETVAQLEKAIAEGKVQKLLGFGERSAEKITEGIVLKAKNKGRRSIGTVYLTVKQMVDALKKCKDVIEVVPAGSFRRGEETVGDIDILTTGKNPGKIMQYFAKLPFVEAVLGTGKTKTTIVTKDGLQVDLRMVAPDEFGSALQYFTGSKLHNVHLRTYAKAHGFKLSEYGFFKGEKRVASKTEEECYQAIGMQYIPPELRTNTGEIEAALAHTLPKLIKVADIKGDLHAHSRWSDGLSTIEQMALAAHARGYEYLAMTDHSPSLTIANGLTFARLKQKKKEIEALNATLPITILVGTEVDILADGSIDYPDEILKQFDIVVASVHSRFMGDNTKRIMKAMENPYVHILGHPSGRLIGKRNPYALDYEKLFKKAAETGTILEINGQPERLDLQDNYIREAKRFGCRFAINSDSHSADSLWLMELGVTWARRGWVEKGDAVNTLPLVKLKKALK